MSAIVAYEGPSFSIIFTDGATYDENIRITKLGRKITVSEKVPLAVATRGNKMVGHLVRDEILHAVEGPGFDRGIRDVEDMMPGWVQFIEENGPAFRTEVLIAGISEKHGPRNLFFQIPGSDEFPTGKLIHQPDFFVGLNCEQGLTIDDMGVPRIRAGQSPVEWFKNAGLAMMEYARKNPSPSPYYEGLHHSTGGQVDMTIVTARGAKVETIHRWNDTIGELIDPSKDQTAVKIDRSAFNVVPITAGMNRQQRRAAERAARKGRAA